MKPDTVDQPLLACRVCLSEIPASVADAAEGRDYVHYFCGADCYTLWREADPSVEPATKEPVAPSRAA